MNWWTSNWASRWCADATRRLSRAASVAGRIGAWGLAIAVGLATPGAAQERELGDKVVLLVAARKMPDPRFSETVVLVTRHGHHRTPIGVILNRPVDAQLDSLLPDLPQAGRHRLHYGGPVDGQVLVFLARGESPPRGGIDVAERVYLSLSRSHLATLLGQGTGPDKLRVFAGFAAWGPNQLEREIARGEWHLMPVDEKALFPGEIDKLWPDLIRRAGLILVRREAAPPTPAGPPG